MAPASRHVAALIKAPKLIPTAALIHTAALAGLVVLGLLSGPAPAALAATKQDQEKTRGELKQLEQDIKQIQQTIDAAREERGEAQEQVREAELALARLHRDIADNNAGVAAQEQELAGLESRREQLQQAVAAQQTEIAAEVRSAWRTSRHSQLKVLFDQEDPHEAARTLAFYRYFHAARSATIDAYQLRLDELATLRTQIDQTLGQLAERRAALDTQQGEMTAARADREAAVTALNADIEEHKTELRSREQDRAELEKVLRAIEQAVARLALPADATPFKTARGKMPWPVAGKHTHRFGAARHEGKLRWQGVTIAATEGTQVKAIHAGRVVFADYLAGSGLLLILDHGDGYMSLYAHNQNLLHNVGDQVGAGTAISTVGNSGAQQGAALYFEVRHQGKPVDPAQWCRG